MVISKYQWLFKKNVLKMFQKSKMLLMFQRPKEEMKRISLFLSNLKFQITLV